jgi:hypothetical protein
MLLATALLIIGLLVVYSADRLVFAASILCAVAIPPIIIGMTVSVSARHFLRSSSLLRHRCMATRSGCRHRDWLQHRQYSVILGLRRCFIHFACILMFCVVNCR